MTSTFRSKQSEEFLNEWKFHRKQLENDSKTRSTFFTARRVRLKAHTARILGNTQNGFRQTSRLKILP